VETQQQRKVWKIRNEGMKCFN